MAENDTSQAMQTMVASANGLAANIGSRREMKRAQQYNLETMEKQNQYNVENYKMQRDDAYKREDWLNANSKRIETKALRDAGLNPAWNESSGLASASSVGAGDIGSPSGSGIVMDGSTGKGIEAFMSTMQLQMQKKQMEVLDTQKKVNESVATKNLADAGKTQLETRFFSDTYETNVGATNTENLKKQGINQYFLDNPDFMKEVSQCQQVFNDNLRQKLKESNATINEINQRISKMTDEQKLIRAQEALTDIQNCYTTKQLEVLEDENFRNNYSNPSWLLNRIDDAIDNNEDAEIIALYRKCYEETSPLHKQKLEQGYGRELKDLDLDFKYTELTVKESMDMIGRANQTIRNLKRPSKGKKTPSGQPNGVGRPGYDRYYNIRTGK